jgi:hypothetical protein
MLKRGIIHKESFWIPKYVANAYDGKRLWLLMDEEELRGKYQYGKEPSHGDQFTKEVESFKGTPYGQNGNYAVDFYEKLQLLQMLKPPSAIVSTYYYHSLIQVIIDLLVREDI